MNTQHTPGPWTVTLSFDATMRREIWTEIDRETGYRELVALIPDAEGEHINGDARLIAAAPDLLHALQMIDSNAAESVEWIRRVARTAIARATGENV